MRTSKKFSISTDFKKKLVGWSRQFQEIAWLDSNNYESKTGEYEAILAVEAFTAIKTDHFGAFDKLKEYQESTADWIFGYLAYDLKNDVEKLQSSNFDGLEFPDLYFFQPQKLIFLKGDQAEFRYLRMVDDEIDKDFEEIENFENSGSVQLPEIEMQPRIAKSQYFEKLDKMLADIHRGDIYEANFCQEFYAENVEIDSFGIYHSLNEISNPPFAAFLKLENYNLISASPERYLKKKGKELLSQPIKGTARRSDDPLEDREIIKKL